MAEQDTYLAIENTDQLLEHASVIVEETDKLTSLREGLRTMSILAKEHVQDMEPVEADWLLKVRDIAYKIQDVVGLMVVETNHQSQKSMLARRLSRKTSAKNYEEIQNIEKEIKTICSFKDDAESNTESHHGRSSIDEVIGFKDSQQTLTNQLIGDMGSQRKVILISGKAGSGKTTLAKMVCNDEKIKNHFKCVEWVNFQQQLSLQELLCRILKRIKSSKNIDNLSTDEVKAEISESLKRNRYLVVIDNIHNRDVMTQLLCSFPDELNESGFLLTSKLTQEELESEQMISLSYEVQALDKNQSWQLLSKKVFEGGNPPEHLESFGKRLADKCKGLPRAILTLAEILNHAEKTQELWSEFLKNYDDLFPKYEKLSPKEKSCLLYFGLFPLGLSPAKQMIKMWMAEGFLIQKGSNKVEEIGEHYLNKLIKQSFIQADTKKADNSGKTCDTDILVSEFCKADATKTFEIHMDKNSKPKKNITRMAIHNDSATEILKSFGDCPHVRSLHCFGKKADPTSLCSAEFKKILNQFLKLQVLNFGYVELDKVPKDLGKLTNLKYINLRASNVKKLPSTIANLQQLLTLDMRDSGLVSLPDGIWKMQFLRHLYVGGSSLLPKPRGIDYYRALSNLQTLYGVQSDKVLKGLMVRAKFPNVTKLRVGSSHLDHTYDFLKSLDHLYHLQSLRLEKPSKLPNQNAFPLSLTKLTLLETELDPECIKTLEKLPNLRILKLLKKAINGENLECSAGGFLQLEELYMEYLDVKVLKLEKGAMRCIKHCFIRGYNDVEIPDQLKLVANITVIEANGAE
ncbi:putative disease resistance protein At1g50180 [Amaranthus tricolor]|uniref:putative disease resistance protein At1g50180 n=1 Tax=Amaranthus tricolor TaxID=29722 RepID=UPI0025862E3B|nr:putative disease resistance protein At1g50180 [Amaranthus tricolor]